MYTNFEDLSLEQLHELKRLVSGPRLEEVQRAIDRRTGTAARNPSTGRWASEPGVPEKEVQRRINRRLRSIGVQVYWLSQARKSGQTPGVPDLLCFDPIRGLFFVEVKAEGGVQSDAQQSFQALCEMAGVPYVLGGLVEIETFFKEEGHG